MKIPIYFYRAVFWEAWFIVNVIAFMYYPWNLGWWKARLDLIKSGEI